MCWLQASELSSAHMQDKCSLMSLLVCTVTPHCIAPY